MSTAEPPSAATPTAVPGCRERSDEELLTAVHLVGQTAELARDLARRLTSTPHDEFDKALLHAMLVAERCIIEFVCGPKAFHDKTTGEWKNSAGDICPQCFIPGWRLTDGKLRSVLEARSGKVGKQIAHLTWRQVERPREWTINKVERALEALAVFATDLNDAHPRLGAALMEHLDETRAPRGGSSAGDPCV